MNIKKVDGNRITFDLRHYGDWGYSERGSYGNYCVDTNVDLIDGKAEFQCYDLGSEQEKSRTCYMYVEGNSISIVSALDTDNMDDLVINTELHKRERGSVEIGKIDTSYMPVNGNYYMGDVAPWMKVKQVDSNSFKFAIYDGRDDNLIFKEHIAVFDTDNPYEAIYRGEKYTLVFNCMDFGIIRVTGFDMISEWGEEFVNTMVIMAG